MKGMVIQKTESNSERKVLPCSFKRKISTKHSRHYNHITSKFIHKHLSREFT